MAKGFCESKLKILPKITLKDSVFIENVPMVFMHPSKTGGGNLDYIIKSFKKFSINYSTNRIICPDSPYRSYDVITEGCLGGITNFRKNPNFYDIKSNKKLEIITGAFPLPEQDYFGVEVNYVTIVRHPLDRMLSMANYLYQGGFIKKPDVERLLFKVEVDNLQTRFIAGESYMSGECTQETFEKAKKNIDEKFKLVVPIEEVEILLSLFAAFFKVENIAQARANITGVKIVSKEDKELSDRILTRNAYDVQLYEYVQKHWNEWKEQHIEKIEDNISADKKYMVLAAEYYNKNHIQYMNLEQVQRYGESDVGLVEGDQLWWS